MAGMDRRNVLLLSAAGVAAVAGAYWLSGEYTKEVRYGVVELGSGGPKWSVLKFHQAFIERQVSSDHGSNIERLSHYQRFEVAVGDIEAEVRNPDAITAVVEAVATARAQLLANRVDPQHSVFVASSSIATLAPDHLRKLQSAFQTARIPMKYVTPQQEAEYTFRWVVPTGDRARALLVDIGSGNTKGGSENTNHNFIPFIVDQGASSIARLAKEAAPAGPTLADYDEAIRKNVVVQARGQAVGIGNEMTYLSGGTCWALASATHPDKVLDANSLWVQITANDIARYRDLVHADPSLMTFSSTVQNPQHRKLMGDVMRAFPQPERIVAGVELLDTLARELHFNAPNSLMYFAKEGQFAWSTMYLLAQMRLEQNV